jgi:signal transduction histidine kinase
LKPEAAKTLRTVLLIIYLLTLVITIVGFSRFASDIGKPFGHFLDYYNGIARAHFILQDTPGWWLNALPEIPREELLQIDGRPYTSRSAKEAFQEAYEDGKPYVVITYDRQDPDAALVPVVRFSTNHFLDYAAPLLILTISVLLGGLGILHVQHISAFNLAMFLVCCGVAVSQAGARPSLWWHDGPISKLMDLVVICGHVAVTIGLFRIIRLFPDHVFKDPDRQLTWIEGLFYSLVGLGGVFWLSSRIMLWSGVPAAFSAWFDKSGYYMVTNLSLIVNPIAGLGKLLWAAFKPNDQKVTRRMSVTTLLGVLLVLPLILISFLKSNGVQMVYQIHYLDLRYLLLTLLVYFAASSLRYHSFGDSPFEPLMIAVILSASGFLSNLLTGIFLTVTGLELRQFNVPPYLFFFALAAVSGLLWSWTFGRRGFFKTLFHANRLNLEAVQSFIQRLFGKIHASNAFEALVSNLSESIQTDHVGLWLRTSESRPTFRLAASTRPDRIRQKQVTLDSIPSEPLVIPHNIDNPRAAEIIQQQNKDIYLIPLSRQGTVAGFIYLESTWDKDFFTPEDLQTINLMSQIAFLFLLVNYHLRIQNATMDLALHAQYYERQRIFKTIHDETLQNLAVLQANFSQVLHLIKIDQEKAWSLVDDMRYDLEDASIELREIISQLNREEKAALSLTAHLEDLLQEARRRRPSLKAELDVDPAVVDILNSEQKIILLSIINRAVDNIIHHAEADSFSVRIWQRRGKIHFEIRDNGRGSTAAERQTAKDSHHFGLLLMKQDTEELLNGQFNFDSQPGEGTCVQGEFQPNPFLM